MKEDDMDEMMRKAAENYEVDADKASDWNAVFTAVHENEAAIPGEKKKRRVFIFWWFLLIPLGWIAHTEYNKYNASSTIIKNTSANSQHTTDNSKQNEGAAQTQANPQLQSAPGVAVDKNKTSSIDNSISNQPTTLKSLNLNKSNRTIFSSENGSANQQNNSDQFQLNTTQTSSSINQTSNSLPGINTNNKNETQQVNGTTNLQSANTPVENKTGNDVQNQTSSPVIAQQSNSSIGVDSSATQQQTAKAKSTTIKIKTNSHYFYGGLVAGTDLSYIKYQKSQPLGYNVGLLVGYKFNKISIESGLTLDKKNYYTSGEYFNKSKIPYFANADLLSANGYCRMYEIPLNIKYDFSSNKRHTWFATAGLSSYLMNKEFYHYAYKRNGVSGYGSYPYFHTTKNWFSVVNLSAGYQLQMNAKTNLRIEPYYKTTLSGVGTGSLHITSTGINIGITRRIP